MTLDDQHICTYNRMVEYEWDQGKARSNREKHGVDFADAVTVFEDDQAPPSPTLTQTRNPSPHWALMAAAGCS
ncbi:MAG: BrnT family toxin [Anaerolineales bacterium]|nr:BrnT family toxin [Anaerolineales bacterium]